MLDPMGMRMMKFQLSGFYCKVPGSRVEIVGVTLETCFFNMPNRKGTAWYYNQ